MWPDDSLAKLFQINLPLIQAPMAGSSGLDMAVAVSEAGGLGSLPCALFDAPGLKTALQSLSERTSRPVNLNFFTHRPAKPDQQADRKWLRQLSGYYKELGVAQPDQLSAGPVHYFDGNHCDVIEECSPAVVSFHFGLPDEKLILRLKAADVKIISSATTTDEARWLADHGCDAVIAQGYEAGGHRGMFLTEAVSTQMGTLSLVPQIVDAVDVPVIAAGGIADGRGIAAAFALGASGVQIGTAYLFTNEATISASYRAALLAANDLSTGLTNVFSGRPARCVMNRAIEELGPFADDAPSFPNGFVAMSPLRAKAEENGNSDFSAHYCGQSAALGRSMSACDLTSKLSEDALKIISGMNQTIR